MVQSFDTHELALKLARPLRTFKLLVHQDAVALPLLFAIFKKFCSACNRVSMSAISVLASSNSWGGWVGG